MICNNCHREIGSAVVCPFCGADNRAPVGAVNRPQPSGGYPNNYYQSPPPNNNGGNSRRTLLIILAIFGAVAVVAIAATIIIFFAVKPSDNPNDPSSDPAAVTAETMTEEATNADHSDIVGAILEKNDNTLQDLNDLGCYQLVTVSSSGSTADIRFFTREGNCWTEDTTLSCSGYVGKNGISDHMAQVGSAAPKGLFHIGEGFYIHDKPDTGLDLFHITSDTYWVDDPDSSYYNKRVEGTDNKDWDSAEHMIDYDEYEYGFVIDYNTQADTHEGSAIFFRIAKEPTAGSVGAGKSDVLGYLQALDASKNPYIIIV